MCIYIYIYIYIYDVGERISSVWQKFQFQNKKGLWKNILMSAASMSQ